MATQIKKYVFGPLTGQPDAEPAVTIRFPDDTEETLKLSEAKGMTSEFVTQLVESVPVAVRSIIHGWSQKVGDSYAGAAKAEAGGETPLAFAKRRVAEVMTQIRNGEWRVTTEGGPRVTELAKGLARATGNTVEEAVQALADKQAELDNEEKKKADNPWKQWSAELRAQQIGRAHV